jgi:hypothetical protein
MDSPAARQHLAAAGCSRSCSPWSAAVGARRPTCCGPHGKKGGSSSARADRRGLGGPISPPESARGWIILAVRPSPPSIFARRRRCLSACSTCADALLHVSRREQTHLVPCTWWFPIVGDVTYKGFFEEAEARAAAAASGRGTTQRGNVAFQHSGWFDDRPAELDALRRDAAGGLVIHELLHHSLPSGRDRQRVLCELRRLPGRSVLRRTRRVGAETTAGLARRSAGPRRGRSSGTRASA